MAQVKIKTLTPVHIGSGRDLMRNTEFLFNDNKVGIVDDKKVVDIIGVENIDKWVSIINKGESLWDYLKQRKVDVSLEDVSNRIMSVYGSNILQKQSLKEQLHSAKLLPMIPGSSIKGAIRTAVISWLVNRNSEKVKSIIDKNKRFFKSKKNNWEWNLRDFQQTETSILNDLLSGSFKMDANKNTFRFLQVSDFTFNYNTIASNMQVVNFYRNKWDIKRGSDQLTEMIAPSAEAEGRILINNTLLKSNIDKKEIRSEVEFLSSVSTLFNIVNEHTKNLVKREIEMWKEDNLQVHEILGTYIDKLSDILQEINSISENDAILRIGGGSGWDSITGAWAKTNTELFDEHEYDILVNLLNKGRDVVYYPKTRKMDEDGDMLGFVRLTII